MRIKMLPIVCAGLCATALAWSGTAALADGAKATPPHIDKNAGDVQLIYPRSAQSNGEEGSIDFAMFIGAGGHPTGRYKLYKSTGYKDLDNAAFQSALGWSYIPAKDADGDSTSGWVPIHLEFRLPKKPEADAGSAKPSD